MNTHSLIEFKAVARIHRRRYIHPNSKASNCLWSSVSFKHSLIRLHCHQPPVSHESVSPSHVTLVNMIRSRVARTQKTTHMTSRRQDRRPPLPNFQFIIISLLIFRSFVIIFTSLPVQLCGGWIEPGRCGTGVVGWCFFVCLSLLSLLNM